MTGGTDNATPPLRGVIETALYVDDLTRSVAWYQRVLGFELIFDGGDRLQAMSVAGRQVLLLFRKGVTRDDLELPAGRVPGHGGDGVLHLAFAVDAAALDAWRQHLEAHQVSIISEVKWGENGRSLYFHDPDGHVLELISPGFWKIY